MDELIEMRQYTLDEFTAAYLMDEDGSFRDPFSVAARLTFITTLFVHSDTAEVAAYDVWHAVDEEHPFVVYIGSE